MFYQRCSEAKLASVLLPHARWQPCPTVDQRDAWDKIAGSVRDFRTRKAQESAESEWPALPATLFLDFERTGNRRRFEKVQFRRRQILNNLVLGECFTDDGRFLDDIANAVWSTCEETFWGLPAHLGAQKAGFGLPDAEEPIVDLFAAETAALLAWTDYVMDGRLDTISPLLHRRIRHEIQRRVLTPCLNRDDFGWMGFGNEWVNNWTPWICSNWLACTLFIEEDPERRSQSVFKMLKSLDVFVDSYPEDGGCDEGPGYWGRAAASLFDCLELLNSATNGAIDFFDEPLVAEMGRYIVRAHIADDWYVNFADASAVSRPDPFQVYRYGVRIGDQSMQRFGAHLARQGEETKVGPNGYLPRLLPALFSMNNLQNIAPQEPLPRDVWLPQTQFMVARDREGSSDGLFLAAKGGHNDESHNHNDVGNFVIFADGRPVLIDVGVENYTRKTFSEDRYDIWTMQSGYHNLPIIDGSDQQPGRDREPGSVSYDASDETTELRMDIAPAWGEDCPVERWQRSLRIRRGHEIKVEDRWELTRQPEQLVLALMTPCEVTGAGKTLKLAERQLPNSRSTGRAIIRVEKGELSPAVEEIPIEDSKLRRVWGDRIFRILLTAENPAHTGCWRISVGRGKTNEGMKE